MNENEMMSMIYAEIVNQVKILHGLRSEREHEFVHEFFEGPIPLFKLILANNEERPFVAASFHIEMEASDAIQWFARVRSLDANLRIAPCYLRDSDGTSYVGEDAQILRLYMLEQDIISRYVSGNKDPEEIVNARTPAIKPSPLKTYSDYKHAISEFNKLKKKDGDTEH